MGVPKFFRYISERYPCLSEVIKEYQIPEFDNLYLDMNGIIHNCSHPNDNDPHFRITEKQIFQDIFHYIEILFRMIQPKQLFFMAIDGVAPRAKMNQQRGRRFRSAKEAEVLEQKAKDKGEQLPTEKRFDSNCITPGTPFMYRLHQQLRYFVKLKMTTDKLWKNVKVILSGHETPGEGEHKIMDYIRYMKSKPDYNPNMRHCLYGLDADLIMLGLCTHEPYFSLLREEVKFNTKSNKGGTLIVTPEETKFFLLHLSLMRDYLELEFSQLKEPGVLSFPFNIEKIIDDWVLMGFLIGNDFIPNLPDLHIIDGAMPLMYKVYREVLPMLGGYINEDGYLNLSRFEKFLTKLASFDFEQFREKYADIQYLEGKTNKKYSDVFLKDKKPKAMDPDLAALIKATDDELDLDDATDEVLNYADYDEYYYSDEDDEWRKNFFSEFGQHKTDYYHYKLDYAKVTNEVLEDQAECYIRAIQWNLHYYYNGCVSWSWYYPHHYAPYISDIKNFSHLNLKYEMGEPFLPFQQLLAVLPAASKELLPKPYQDLMTLENSPILEYYPEEFQTDLNGKKQDWEAVVLIPFIDEAKLIKAMDDVDHLLTDEERSRNRHGPMLLYTYTHENLGVAPAPEHFSPIQENHAMEKSMYRDDIYVHPSRLNKGLCKNVNMSLYHTHFPTLKHLKFTHKIEMAKVKVFQQPSRNESVIVRLQKTQLPSLKQVADQILGKTILINYPHLVEIRVQAISTKDCRISYDYNNGPVYEKTNKDIHDRFQLSKKSITDDYLNKQGVDIGNTEILVYGQPVESRKYVFGPRGKVTQQRTYIRTTVIYAYQTAVLSVQQARESLEYKTIDEIFYPGCQCFTLCNPLYGSEGCVIGTVKDEHSHIKLSLKVLQEPDLYGLVNLQDTAEYNYLPGYTVATKLSISPLLLSRFTGSIFIIDGMEDNSRRKNIGLNIKFSRKNEEVVGFTRRDENTKKWFYTERVVTLIKDYMRNFPEVFHFLKDHSSDDIYLRDEVFPNQGAERVNEIVNWLKEQPHSKAEVRPCGAAVVDETIVKLIEHAVDRCEKTEKRMTLLVKPNKLYIPKPTLDKVCVDPDTKFDLFNRVVNIRDCYTVPLGYRGTVIGIIQGETNYDTMYDVVFDKPFPHGVSIRCSEGRGYRMAAQALINLTYGERLYGNNPHAKNVNGIRSRNERSTTNYAQATKQTFDNKPISVLKENSPPPVNTNLQVSSPYPVKVSGSKSQQSSVSQSPSSTAFSHQGSPYNAIPNEKVDASRNIHQTVHIVQYKKPLGPKMNEEQKGDKLNGNDQKVVINKERCIFSNATPLIPTTQNSELLTGGLSFFGPKNILDIPENKNKLFTGEITATKTDVKEKDSEASVKEITSQTKHINMNSVDHKPDHKPFERTFGRTLSERSENGFNISLTDLVKQNNITAAADFPTTGGMFSGNKNYKSTPSKEEEGKDTSFTTKLTEMFYRGSAQDNEAESRFKRAISAMVQQSPQLIENREELQPAPIELSFEEKHASVKNKTESTPTIKTEMRKVVSSSDCQDVEEEEEVMIIEMQEYVKTYSEPGTTPFVPSADPFQEFLSKLKTNKQPLETNVDMKDITTVGELETQSESNINTFTANTINEFFAEASRRHGSEQKNRVSQKDHSQSIEPSQENKESSADASDMLKKMLNIESLSSAAMSLPTGETFKPTSMEQIETPPVSVPTHLLAAINPVNTTVLSSTSPNQGETTSASISRPFSTVIGSTGPDVLARMFDSARVDTELNKSASAFAPVKSTSVPSQSDKPNNVLSSLKSGSQTLNPCVQSFIPPQVQKKHIDKMKPAPQSQLYEANLYQTSTVPPRGIPILGSQSVMYEQAQYQYYYNQSAGQPIYYQQQVPYVQNKTFVNHPQSVQNLQMQSQKFYPSNQFQVMSQTNQKSQQNVWQQNLPQGATLPYQNNYQTLPGQSNTSQFLPYQGHQVQGFPVQQPSQPQRVPLVQPIGHMKHEIAYNQSFAPNSQAALQNSPQPGTSEPLGVSGPEEQQDSFLYKLLHLTRIHQLGTPEYNFSIDGGNHMASVRIAHPHSDIVVRGKPCSRKSDAAEVCARRAFNELTQLYPATKLKARNTTSNAAPFQVSLNERNPASQLPPNISSVEESKNVSSLPQTSTVEVGITSQEPEESTSAGTSTSGEKEKKKQPRIAAKFKVPLKPKN